MGALAVALPIIPSVSCPPAAIALAGAGLAPVCQATAGLTGIFGSAASKVVGFGVGSVLDAVSSWVSSGAVWLLGQIGGFLAVTTSVELGASWFTSHYKTMADLAGLVVLPLLLAAVIQAIHRQSASLLLRSVVVNVPLSIVLTAVAIQLVQLGLAVTDSMSAAVARGSGVEGGHFFGSVITGLGNPAVAASSAPSFIVLLGSLAVVMGAFLLWIELLMRAAAVYVAVLFLPLALASLAWPAISHWCRRLVDTLVALILGKFVIVAVLSLAAGSNAAGSNDGGSGGGFTAVLAGAALLALAAASPWALFRLLPMMEAGAVGHLEGVGRRTAQTFTGPAKSMAYVAMAAATSGTSEVGPAMAAGAGAGAGVGGSGGGGSGGAAGSGGAGPTPNLGPSSADVTGVGSASPPGSGVGMHKPDVGFAERFEAALGEDDPAPDGTRLDSAVRSPRGYDSASHGRSDG